MISSVLTVVDGRVLYSDGRVTTFDETALAQKVNAARDRLAV